MDDVKETQALAAAVRDLVRVGRVVSANPNRMTARVEFPDAQDVVSYDLPVLVRRAHRDKDYSGLPDIGDQAVCLFLGNGAEAGFVLGVTYSGGDPVPLSSRDKPWHWTFEDGSVIEYDRSTHKLTADIKGSAKISATETATLKSDVTVRLVAPTIIQEGNVVTTGTGGGSGNVTETANRTINGNLTVNGSITATGTIMNAGGNSNHHSH